MDISSLSAASYERSTTPAVDIPQRQPSFPCGAAGSGEAPNCRRHFSRRKRQEKILDLAEA
jgi:hypothetical protein